MKKWIEFCVQNPWTTLSLGICLAVLGVFSALKLPLDAVPDITNKQVQVNTAVEGLAPEQIERQVTFPLEAALSGLPGIVNIRSITRPRLSQLTVVFEESADLMVCRQLIAERLPRARSFLPEGVVPEMGPISTGLGEVYFYTLQAKKPADGEEGRREEGMRLREIQEWEVAPRLRTVPGVAEVNVSGGYERQALVKPDLEKMARRGIHLDDLAEALRRANRTTGGGIIEQGAEQFSVSAVGALPDLASLKGVPVKPDQSLASVKVGDVAEVSWGQAPRTGAAGVNGRDGMVCTVMMLAGENSRTVSSRIAARVREVAGDLPEGVELLPLYDRSELVNRTLNTVAHNLLLGAALVVLVLVFLLGNPRAAFITSVTIPLAMLMAFLVMVPLGVSGNLMSLGAIDFGILVDGAVIVLDHCVRQVAQRRAALKRNLNRGEIRKTVLEATLEVRSAAGFGQLIIVAALLPLFGLTGVEAKTFTPMALTLALALAAAWIVSFSVSPALAGLFLSGGAAREPWLMKSARRIYEPVLWRCLKVPKTLLLAGAAAVATGLFVFTRLGAVFMPQLDEGSILLQFIRPQTISLSEAIHLQEVSEKLILEFGEVEKVFSRTGTPEIATDPMGVNLSDTYVMLKPGLRDKQRLVEALVGRLEAEVPGQRILATQPIQMRFNELLEGTRAEVAVKVYGDDLEAIFKTAQEVSEVIREVRGAGDVELEVQGTTPIFSIRPDYALLSNLGVSPGAVLESVETALAGTETGFLFGAGGRRYPVVVRLDEADRQDLDAVARIVVPISSSDTRPLGDLASLKFEDSYDSITREQARRRAAVLVNPRGRDVESFVLEAQKEVAARVKLPAGCHVEWGGAFENLRAARARLAWLTPLALVLVLGMVYAAFGDALLALLVFAGVPLALVGGVAMLALRGIPFSISAGVGFIALAGIAVLNGVVLVSTSLALEKNGMKAGEAIREAAVSRLRPVLMTAMVEIFGFLPMMFSGGAGGEVQRPLASVVVGGVISSTLLTLAMLPSWQTWLERRRKPRHFA